MPLKGASRIFNKIHHGDCLDVLKTMEDNSVDSVVTDPPYGLSKEPDIREVLSKWMDGEPYDHGHGGFMGKSWDGFVPHPDIWREVYRVLKPGGHALVFAGTRTQDLMTISLRLAGFEVRDVIEWLYFSGFPKSHDVSKAFDRRAGAEREVVGSKVGLPGYSLKENDTNKHNRTTYGKFTDAVSECSITAPATELARKWDGWGTALKPSHEPIIVVRKPLIDADTRRKLTVVDCVEKYGTGAINVDASRIGDDEVEAGRGGRKTKSTFQASELDGFTGVNKGRFPANCITLDSDAFYSKYFNITPAELSKKASKKDRNSDWQGEEITLPLRDKTPNKGSTFKSVDVNGSGKLTNGTGKVAPTRNTHPTVKPTDLMAWLVRLVTPPNGTVLDPFAGSGSTLVAAKREGFGFIGIEREAEYVEIIEVRVGVKATEKELSTRQRSITSII